jgi:hypothetical protein
MSEFSRDPQMGTQECCGEFGDQLLGGIGLRAEPVLEIPVEPLLGTTPMTIMPMSA